jgi:hypothetical protein
MKPGNPSRADKRAFMSNLNNFQQDEFVNAGPYVTWRKILALRSFSRCRKAVLRHIPDMIHDPTAAARFENQGFQQDIRYRFFVRGHRLA